MLFIISGIVHLLFGCVCGSTSRLRGDELFGIGFLFLGLFLFSLVYSMAAIIGGAHYHDGLASLMPKLLPYILVGVTVWFLKKSKLTEKPPGTEDEEHYLEEKIKLLRNEQA